MTISPNGSARPTSTLITPTGPRRSRRLQQAGLAALTLALTTATVAAGAPADAAVHTGHHAQRPKHKPHRKPVRLAPLSYYGFGYGSDVAADTVGLGSDRTAYAVLGCTRAAGGTQANNLAAVTNNPALQLGALNTITHSLRTPTGTALQTDTSIASVDLGSSSAVRLQLTGLSDVARVDATRAGRLTPSTSFDLAGVSLGGPLGALLPPSLTSMLNGDGSALLQRLAQGPLTIPSLGELSLGRDIKQVGPAAAVAQRTGLVVHLFGPNQVSGGGDDTTAQLGNSYARISRGAPRAVFVGRSYAVQGTLAGGLATLGSNVYLPMQCEGTGGRVQQVSALAGNPGNAGALTLGVATARDYGVQNKPRKGASGFTESRVAGIDVGGMLQISSVLARATVSRDARNRLSVSPLQQTGGITAGGNTYAAPGVGQTLVIPGVASLTVPPVTRTPSGGLNVVGLRVTLLAGSAAGSVVDLANAQLSVRRQ